MSTDRNQLDSIMEIVKDKKKKNKSARCSLIKQVESKKIGGQEERSNLFFPCRCFYKKPNKEAANGQLRCNQNNIISRMDLQPKNKEQEEEEEERRKTTSSS